MKATSFVRSALARSRPTKALLAPVRNLHATRAVAQADWDHWDQEVQTFHGGQDWAGLDNFVEDFSVTTNGFGAPEKALEAAKASVDSILHYPPADFEPCKTDLAQWMWNDTKENSQDGHSRMLLGNGASELIDLVIRDSLKHAPAHAKGEPTKWKPGGDLTQYKEYERSAKAAGYATTTYDDKSAQLTCLVNPNNPTGAYLPIEEMKTFIENSCQDGSTVLVDESMQPWLGPHWREDSLIRQSEWMAEMERERGMSVWLMHSWTKIWSCAGLRLGSVTAPSAAAAKRVLKIQVPWTLNTPVQRFLSEVVKDEEYMDRTWELTPKWRTDTADAIQKRFPHWTLHGEPFLSWIWIDTHSEESASAVVKHAKAGGCPVRSGAPGYNMPSFFRVAVRSPEQLAAFMASIEAVKK